MSDLPFPILSRDAPCEAPVSVIDNTENPLKHKNTSKTCFNPETCHTADTVQKKSDLEKIQDLLAWKPWEISEKVRTLFDFNLTTFRLKFGVVNSESAFLRKKIWKKMKCFSLLYLVKP
jgi:hypothetical protein